MSTLIRAVCLGAIYCRIWAASAHPTDRRGHGQARTSADVARLSPGTRTVVASVLRPGNQVMGLLRCVLFEELGFEVGDASVDEAEVGPGSLQPFLQFPVFLGELVDCGLGA
ncbi:hypothetical protein [Streptomyces sp. NPDC051219]|uniref:hypothetical protein n=1 Tax=Streptomyces sp. NPDC051219 TaxID=3155283 RepID=UPI003419E8B1